MNISAISLITPPVAPPVPHNAAAPAASQPAAASSPTDTVSLSPAAQKAPQAGDVDRDGDSR
jgi:hypothetical protein